MGAIDETRKVLQDIIAPDLKAIDARITALEKRLDYRVDGLDKRIDGLEKRMDQRFSDAEKRESDRFSALNDKIDLKHEVMLSQFKNLADMVNHNLDLDRRVERIELGMAQGAKERLLERTA